MLETINSFFEKYLSPTEENHTDEEAIDKIHLACAALMIELCKADHSIDDNETKKVSSILQTKFALREDTLKELFNLAQQEANQATSVYQFTSLINEAYDQPAKIMLIQNMWEIAFADGNLYRYEEHLIRKVAELLYVSHSDFIKTKIAVKKT
ncbi:MAG: TerB family tellurite resistance protein [Pseudohongiellaceae bacterium]